MLTCIECLSSVWSVVVRRDGIEKHKKRRPFCAFIRFCSTLSRPRSGTISPYKKEYRITLTILGNSCSLSSELQRSTKFKKKKYFFKKKHFIETKFIDFYKDLSISTFESQKETSLKISHTYNQTHSN